MIKVENVSMKFRMNHDNVNSLKEFAIAAARRRLKYKDFWVFRDISFEVKKGEVVGIIGRNGAGKSTLLKIISGILSPTAGKVTLAGRVVPMLELGSGFDFELTGRENIFLNGSILGCSESFLREKYAQIVAFSELGAFIETPIRNYSSGMMMRLAFSIATIVQPEILIVDEILAVGDEAFQKKSRRKMLELMGGGTTVLFVSHSIAQVREMCSRVIWLENGRVKMQGETKYVCDKYQEYMNPTQEETSGYQQASDVLRNLSDVLFIYGEDRSDAYGWRVTNQREQLVAGAVPTNEICADALDLDMVRLYRLFICVNCKDSPKMRDFFRYVKEYHKTVLFDFSGCSHGQQKEDPQKSLLSITEAKQCCSAVLVSSYELAQTYQKKGWQTFVSPLSVAEELLKYASWAVYDREVLPFLDKRDLTEEELVNYNRALQQNREHAQDGTRIGYFQKRLSGREAADLWELLDASAMEWEQWKLAIEAGAETDGKVLENENLQSKLEPFRERILFWRDQTKADLVRRYAQTDVVLLLDYGWEDLLPYWIYASFVKVPCFLLQKTDCGSERGSSFFRAGQNIAAGDACAFWKFLAQEKLRKQIAETAYRDVMEHHCTVKTGDALARFVRQKMRGNIAFLVSELSFGGVGWVACHHAALLKKRGVDVLLLTTGQKAENIIFDGENLPVVSRDMIYSYRYFDRMAAFDWQSAQWMQDYANAGVRYYMVRGFETDYYPPGNIIRLKANQMYTPHVPMQFAAPCQWCQSWLADNYGQSAQVLQEGTAFEMLHTIPARLQKFQNQKRKVLLAASGALEAEHLREAFQIADLLDPQRYQICSYFYHERPDVEEEFERKYPRGIQYRCKSQQEVWQMYGECEILLLTATGICAQAQILDMMAAGGAVVAAREAANRLFLSDGGNCALYAPGNVEEAAACIRRISEEEDYRKRLLRNAQQTASEHDWSKMDPKIIQYYTEAGENHG